MDNLSFGWEFGLMMILIGLGIVFIYLAFYYVLSALLGQFLIKLTNLDIHNANVFLVALPFMVSSTVVSFILILPLNYSIFQEYYFTDLFSFIFCLTCLNLTRFYYTKDWILIKRTETSSSIATFLLWTTVNFIITFPLKRLALPFIPNYLLFSIVASVTTLLLLKWRNIRDENEKARTSF